MTRKLARHRTTTPRCHSSKLRLPWVPARKVRQLPSTPLQGRRPGNLHPPSSLPRPGKLSHVLRFLHEPIIRVTVTSATGQATAPPSRMFCRLLCVSKHSLSLIVCAPFVTQGISRFDSHVCFGAFLHSALPAQHLSYLDSQSPDYNRVTQTIIYSPSSTSISAPPLIQ